MNAFEREEARRQKDFEQRNADRIKIDNDNYWDNLEYHTIVTCTKEQEEKYLQEELEDLKRLKGLFPKRLA